MQEHGAPKGMVQGEVGIGLERGVVRPAGLPVHVHAQAAGLQEDVVAGGLPVDSEVRPDPLRCPVQAGPERPSPLVGAALDLAVRDQLDRKSTRLNSSHIQKSRMPSSA